MARVRRVESERELEKQIDEFVTKGYKIKEQSQYSAKVKEKDWGSPPVHGFVFLFALLGSAFMFGAAGVDAGGAWVVAILANLLYAAYSRISAQEVIIKVDEDSED